MVTFPGSNCDQDAIYVLRHLLQVPTDSIWHQERDLPSDLDLMVLPGGFSYGDALRSGAIASTSPVMGAVKAFADRGGTVLGICNGFQVLLEGGLLPGAMLQNSGEKFVCKPVELVSPGVAAASLGALTSRESYRFPVAHHEGRYFVDPETLSSMKDNRQILFRYVNNPNGSVDNIAGVTNRAGNVFGMMPHPERACEDLLGSSDGLSFFRTLIEGLR